MQTRQDFGTEEFLNTGDEGLMFGEEARQQLLILLGENMENELSISLLNLGAYFGAELDGEEGREISPQNVVLPLANGVKKGQILPIRKCLQIAKQKFQTVTALLVEGRVPFSPDHYLQNPADRFVNLAFVFLLGLLLKSFHFLHGSV